MKQIVSTILPFEPFNALNFFGVLIVRKDKQHNINDRVIRHESIHTAQMKELLYVFFYIIYFLEWIYRLVFHTSSAYEGLSFEKEAYANQDNPEYLETRRHYAQWRRQKADQ